MGAIRLTLTMRLRMFHGKCECFTEKLTWQVLKKNTNIFVLVKNNIIFVQFDFIQI